MGHGRLSRVSIRVVVTTFWVIMVGWLLRYEAFPEHFTHSLAGYKGLLSSDVLIQDTWMEVLFKGTPIGYTHTTVETQDDDPMAYYQVLNRSYMQLKVMGVTQPVYVDTTANVDISQTLQGFSFVMSSRGNRVNISGKRNTGDMFDVRVVTGHHTQRSQVEIPPDVVLYSPMTEMGLRRLKPGQSLMIRTLDPASMTPVNLDVKAIRPETIQVNGRDYETTLLHMRYQGVKIRSWIDAKGIIIRQETPFGWTMETCTAAEAFEAVSHSSDAPDILSELAVRCKGVIENSRESTRIRYAVHGVDIGAEAWATSRQTAEVSEDGTLHLTVAASSTSSPAEPLTDPEPYLASTTFVQSDEPALRSRAEKIVAESETPMQKARAIYEWVYENVKKEPTISLPSAMDVLKTMAGDCNEHTYLYVGLARAAGLPAKIMVGIAYHEGAFYYHAWPAVHVGRWVEMDPTWGQPLVDATHIRITEGELANQLELVQTVGTLTLDVLEQE
ncbi:MAG: transglutaminase-like domain-containing protein [Kiritimatiellae bacterium]|nr:transglutaminase-like domain-containing protein [Kiritimatiellia bacterium]